MNKEMSETLTRVGPGTRMGNLMRRYWVPALACAEIPEPDGPQVRVQLLGEKLLAFRNTDGQACLIGEFCSHRGVSLYFGRNEENGILCAYHGVKFDGKGQCVDVPSSPQACSRMHIKGYPCVERGGIVWAYMGPADLQPAPPELEWCTLPPEHVFVSKRLQYSNWLQAMEGGIDTAHVSYVHRFEVDTDPMHQGVKALDYIKADGNVKFEIEQTPFGLSLFGRRNGEADSYYWRITQYLFPWFTLIAPFGEHALGGHVWVPIDDHSCWAWSINWQPAHPLTAEERTAMEEGKGIHVEYEAPGSFVPKANRDNDYLIDREEQASGKSYSGIQGIGQQDQAMVESMEGPEEGIVDRGFENLAASDRMIAITRRCIIAAAQAHQKDGTVPSTVDRPELTRGARGGSFIAPDSVDWLDAYAGEMRKAQSPAGFLLQAAE